MPSTVADYEGYKAPITPDHEEGFGKVLPPAPDLPPIPDLPPLPDLPQPEELGAEEPIESSSENR